MKISPATYCNHTSAHLIFLRKIRQLLLSYTKCIKSRVSSGLSPNNPKPKLQLAIFNFYLSSVYILATLDVSSIFLSQNVCFHLEEVENVWNTLCFVFYLFSFLSKYVTCEPILEHVPIKPFYFDFWEIRISSIWAGNSKPRNIYLFVGESFTYRLPPNKLIQQNFYLHHQRPVLNRFVRRLTGVFPD